MVGCLDIGVEENVRGREDVVRVGERFVNTAYVKSKKLTTP